MAFHCLSYTSIFSHLISRVFNTLRIHAKFVLPNVTKKYGYIPVKISQIFNIHCAHIVSYHICCFFFFLTIIYIYPPKNNIIICILQGLPYLIIRKACMSVPLFRENVCHDQNMKKSFVHYDH